MALLDFLIDEFTYSRPKLQKLKDRHRAEHGVEPLVWSDLENSLLEIAEEKDRDDYEGYVLVHFD